MPTLLPLKGRGFPGKQTHHGGFEKPPQRARSSLNSAWSNDQLLTMLHVYLLVLTSCALGIGAKTLWANEPAAQDNIIMTAYPVGNGKLGGKCPQFCYLFCAKH
jgi:hypothetical protein